LNLRRRVSRRIFEYRPREYWERRGETYRSAARKLERTGSTAKQLKTIGDGLNQLKPRSVLEIGCGSGRISRTLASAAETYIGVDIAKSMLTQARACVPKPGVGWILAFSANLPFRDKVIDTIVASEVLLHVPPQYIAHSMSEIARVARTAIILDFFDLDFENRRTFRRVSQTLDSHNFLHNYPELFRTTGLSIVSRGQLPELSQTCFVLKALKPRVSVMPTHSRSPDRSTGL